MVSICTLTVLKQKDSGSYKYNNLSDRQLACLYTTTPMNREDKVIRKFAEFIKTTGFYEENLFHYDYRDLFEWEYKMCQWHSWLLLESDMSHVPRATRLGGRLIK